MLLNAIFPDEFLDILEHHTLKNFPSLIVAAKSQTIKNYSDVFKFFKQAKQLFYPNAASLDVEMITVETDKWAIFHWETMKERLLNE